MGSLSKIIALGIVGVCLYLFAGQMQKPAESRPKVQWGERESHNNPEVYLKLKDKSGVTVQGFITANLVHHVRKQGSEAWCQFVGSPHLYHLKDFYTEGDQSRLSPADTENGVDFRLMVTLACSSHRVKNPGQDWTGWMPGHPFRGHEFMVERIDGKFRWTPTYKITPI